MEFSPLYAMCEMNVVLNGQADTNKIPPNTPDPATDDMLPKLPKGFVILCEIPKHSGGGWLCDAPVATLLKMRPKYNLKSRTDPDRPDSHINSLAKSIETHGLCQFPIVNNKEMIDGNRRTKATNVNGTEWMTVIYRPWATPSTYADSNQETKPHTAIERQWAWLQKKGAATHGTNCRIDKAVKEIDIDLVKWVIRQHRDVVLLVRYAKKAWKHCERSGDRKTFLQNAVKVQVEHKDSANLRRWVEEKKSPVKLYEKIMEGSSLKCC